MKITFFSISISILLLFNSCKESTTDSSFPIIQNLQLTITKNGISQPAMVMNLLTSYAVYDTTTKTISCIFIGTDDAVPGEIRISIPGKYAGAYMWWGTASVSILMSSSRVRDQNELWHSTGGGQTQFTGYGKIGEQIQGTFFGNFVRTASTSQDSLFIEGTFETTIFQ